jgi:hypothetical protein
VHWPLSLPAILWIVRRLSRFVVPHESAESPVVALFPSDQRPSAAARLASATLARSNLVAAALLTAVISIVDVWEVAAAAVQHGRGPAAGPPREKDWSVFFAGAPELFAGNLLHDVVAFTAQGVAILMALTLVVVFLRHNVFLLRHVYQRRLPGTPRFAIDINDTRKRCGLFKAHRAFNAQVALLVIAGPFFLVTRYQNVPPERQAQFAKLPSAFGKLFRADASELQTVLGDMSVMDMLRDPGQWMSVVGWLATLLVVFVPLAVKFLPQLLKPRIERDIVKYLEEFLPDDRLPWRAGEDPSEEVLNGAAKRFSQQEFWPAGNQLAWWLFFSAFLVLGLILFPIPLEPGSIVPLVAIGAIAAALTKLLFKMLEWSLAVVDPRLVHSPKE